MLVAGLYLKVADDEYVPVVNCTVEPTDAGVFVVGESEARSAKASVTWRRIATLSKDSLERVTGRVRV